MSRWSVLVFSFAMWSVAIAEEAIPLTLRKAVEIATAPEGNTKVELAAEAFLQAQARSLQARAALFPALEGVIGYQDVTRNLQAFGIELPSIPGFTFSPFVGPFRIFDARASLSQSVFDLSLVGRYRATRSVVEGAKLDRDWVRQQVTEQVARAYLAALLAEGHVEAAQANLVLAERMLRLARSQKEAGTGTAIEVTRAEVQLAHERQRLQIVQNERARAHLRLLQALDLRLDAQLQLVDRLGFQVTEPLSIEQALEMALNNRADYQSQRQRESAVRMQYAAVKAERLPSLGAFADYGSIGPGAGQARATRTIGFALRVPVWDGGRRQARQVEVASQLRAEEIRSRELRRQLELDLRIAFDNLRSAETQVATAEEGLRLAQKEFEQAERRYQAGVASSLEATDAQTRLVRARDNRLQALYQHNVARLELGSALGAIDRYLP